MFMPLERVILIKVQQLSTGNRGKCRFPVVDQQPVNRCFAIFPFLPHQGPLEARLEYARQDFNQ